MAQVPHSHLRYKRALLIFILAYIAVTVFAIALSMAFEAIMHPPPSNDMVHSPSYLLSERFYPLINLLVWSALSWVYFKPFRNTLVPYRQAFALGAFWLALALVVDYVGFVLIKNPLSLSVHDFYVGQFPWIYLIYLAIFISPNLCLVLKSRLRVAQV